MLKVFKIWVDKCSWDEYDSCIVLAESEDYIRSNMMEIDEYGATRIYGMINNCKDEVWFNVSQGELHIDELDLNGEPQIAEYSFNAG